MNPPSVTTSVSHTPDHVTVSVTVENDSDRAIWLVDRFLAHGKKGPVVLEHRAGVRLAPDPARPVYLVVAHDPPALAVLVELLPVVRKVEPAQSFSATFTFPKPLQTFHPAMPIQHPALRDQALLELGWFDEAPVTEEVVLADKRVVPMLAPASASKQHLLRLPVDGWKAD